jgi:F-type H+-transporting ATPase subunit delta
MANPVYVAEDRKKVLATILNRFELSKALQSFLLLLFDKGRIGLISGINEYYQVLLDELRGISRASVVSAADLSSEAIEKIRKALSKLTGKDVKLDVQTNPDLIGGIVTRIGDLVLDGSIKTQLLSMKESLKRGESI